MVEPAPERVPPLHPARVPLGLAIVVVERIRADLGLRPLPTVGAVAAFIVGLGDAATSTGRRVVSTAANTATAVGRPYASTVVATGRVVLAQPVVERVVAPVWRLGSAASSRAAATVVRGRRIADAARADAITLIRAESEEGIAWVREAVLPVVIDDLVRDPKVRELVVEQTQGALSDAAHEVRHRTAHADARLEAGVRRLLGGFGRHEPAS